MTILLIENPTEKFESTMRKHTFSGMSALASFPFAVDMGQSISPKRELPKMRSAATTLPYLRALPIDRLSAGR